MHNRLTWTFPKLGGTFHKVPKTSSWFMVYVLHVCASAAKTGQPSSSAVLAVAMVSLTESENKHLWIVVAMAT